MGAIRLDLSACGKGLSWVLEEPNLEFGKGEHCPDPKAGIALFGPPYASGESPSPSSLRIGVIGSADTVELVKGWVRLCKNPIASVRAGSIPEIDFPGFRKDRAFQCEASVDDGLLEVIPQGQLKELGRLREAPARMSAAVDEIVGCLSNLAGREPRPNVTIIALPKEVIDSCVLGIDRFGRRSSGRRSRSTKQEPKGRQVRIEDFLPSYEAKELEITGAKHYSNLRRAIKLEALKLGLETQIVWQSTLEQVKGSQDMATVAWNFFVGMYYKGGGHPWHLGKPQMGTCYVGVSFFFPESAKEPSGLDASIAQVFSHTGDGMVIRGDRAAQYDSENRTPRLSMHSARSLVEKALNEYKSQTKTVPSRLVIHKSSGYSEDEIEGIRSAASEISRVDLLAIDSSRYSFYRCGLYPPLRGTVIPLTGYGSLVYTKAYSPYLGTYPGLGVPRPLVIREHHGDSTVSEIARDILALTKLNWNTADFSCGMPITLNYSRKVGEILKQGLVDGVEKWRFSYFI